MREVLNNMDACGGVAEIISDGYREVKRVVCALIQVPYCPLRETQPSDGLL